MGLIKKSLVIVFILITSIACKQEWYLSIDKNSGINPILCFSSGIFGIADALGVDKGVQFYSLSISEVNSKDELIQAMWEISYDFKSGQPNNATLKKLTYGVLPSGWTEKRPAKPIMSGRYYDVQGGEFYFTKSTTGKYQVFSRSEFFNAMKL
jgi:hypothetical protein